MKKLELWKVYGEDRYFIVDPKEIVNGVYEYWDGCDCWPNPGWRPVAKEEVEERIRIVVDEDDSESLDAWDGPVWTYRKPLTHGTLYKVVYINGKKTSNKWLIKESALMQRTPDIGRIVDEGELEAERNWALPKAKV